MNSFSKLVSRKSEMHIIKLFIRCIWHSWCYSLKESKTSLVVESNDFPSCFPQLFLIESTTKNTSVKTDKSFNLCNLLYWSLKPNLRAVSRFRGCIQKTYNWPFFWLREWYKINMVHVNYSNLQNNTPFHQKIYICVYFIQIRTVSELK